MRWLIGIGIVIVGVIVAGIVSKIVKKVMGSPDRPERLRSLAPAAASAISSILLGIGLMVGLGVASPKDVENLPGDIIGYIPRLLVALIVILLGSALATLVGNLVGEAAVRATGKPQPLLARITRTVVVALATVLAISQIGIDTRVIDLIVAAAVWGVAGTVAALTVLGGREIAGEISAGRYMKRIISVGDRITINSGGEAVSGTVVSVHGATVEVETARTVGPDGVTHVSVVHMPHRRLLEGPLHVSRNEAPPTK
jgi:hypothetical protein